jgi:hypothetical protein
MRVLAPMVAAAATLEREEDMSLSDRACAMAENPGGP